MPISVRSKIQDVTMFHVKFLVQLILNLCELFLGIKITMNQFSHDIRATAGQGSAS